MPKLPVKSRHAYADLLGQVKSRIRQAQTKAMLAANAEMIRLYWDIGNLVHQQQQQKGWGKAVIPRLARDIRNDLPEVKGFSERNIGYMIRFAREYPILQRPVAKLPSNTAAAILQQPAAKLLPGPKKPILHQAGAKLPIRSPNTILHQAGAKLTAIVDAGLLHQLALQLPWKHNILLFEKIEDLDIRLWYIRQTIQNGWSRDVLSLMIDGQAHRRQGKAITNFTEHFPPAQSDLAVGVLKDPYIFDFLTLEEPFHERELETQLLVQLQKFLVELGQGFAFVGRQFPINVGGEDFYIDLLFYHLHLRCFVIIDLKKGSFKAEHAGKMNLYLNVIDDKLRHPTDSPSIGLILCQDRNRVVAEYALRGMQKPIGISAYELTRALPKEFRSSLPTIEQIESELEQMGAPKKARSIKKKKSFKQRSKR